VELKRGDVVVLAAPGDYGKPRPAVIVQSDRVLLDRQSFIVCLFTTTLRNASFFRINVEPSPGNGLREPSEIMSDKIQAVDRTRIRQKIGSLEPRELDLLASSLKLILDLE